MKYRDMIIALRNKLIITQEELAKMLDVSYVSVNRWENGRHEPTIKLKRKLFELCKENGIEVD
ncbi:MAG: helix-turn-helix transcriptional regulator [Bacilli bacterium]